ncbi:hypothetical protein NPX13_g5213 [Xylaria arbuscula]|uniref:Heterokaryon incompatibility domain-containing protein n=1 Tax=Xylaria arbuscula TaxID=114810 RepID=A0A9W8NF08_9PEZI|nr:hypothetical protein NPX13_g5213 [Xylaria arbuscula]
MWLINAKTRLLEEFVGFETPEYAILSHTWEQRQEVTFQEFIQEPRSNAKTGYSKIDQTCQQAIRDGLNYVWVDTCCIDKSSSAELSEAINSMFLWYSRAMVCYVFLVDLPCAVGPDDPDVQNCRWFTRAWTLQELIAPAKMKFYAQDWQPCFTKDDASEQLSRITGINLNILRHQEPLSAVCVAQKMSWARSRRATREEDIAYSLMGIFDINMPLLYGEGQKAFMRLQSEIIQSSPDLSILAWFDDALQFEEYSKESTFSTVLASSPDSFKGCDAFTELQNHSSPVFSVSNRGLHVRAKFGLDDYGQEILPVCQLNYFTLAIKVRNIGAGYYVRQDPSRLSSVGPWQMTSRIMSDPFLLTKPVGAGSWDRVFGWEPLLSLRQHGLEIVLEPDMEIYRRWPWKKWDEVDRLFFGPADRDLGWGALKIVSQPPGNFTMPGGRYSLDFLLYVFGWAKPRSEPRYTVHVTHGTLSDRALEEMNETAAADDWNPYWVANRLAANNVPERSTVELTATGRTWTGDQPGGRRGIVGSLLP